MSSLINTQVQPFKTQAFHNGKFVQVSNETLKGEWSVLIFMPAACSHRDAPKTRSASPVNNKPSE